MKVKGKYTKAKIFTDVIEESALRQVRKMCDYSPFRWSKIRIMPDVHAGAGCTIGTTMTIWDKVVPNMVGVDIGCGMAVAQLKEREIDFAALDAFIRQNIPAGMTSREAPHAYAEKIDLSKLHCAKSVNLELAKRSVGTLGGGNHFIEADRDEDGTLYLVVHSGSRHLGVEVAGYYQKQAVRQMNKKEDERMKKQIEKLKRQKNGEELGKAITVALAMREQIDPDRAYVSGELFWEYLDDMELVQEFADYNRQAIIDTIVRGKGLTVTDTFTTVHNYIDTEDMILRKGAVSARKGERLLIPINMRDGSLICVGKGKRDWNYSAPHGAGRAMSRGRAFATLSMEEFERQMQGIYTTSVCPETLDESPMAYKTLEDITKNIAPTVRIVKRILPVYNFKASEDVPRRKKKA